jgi:hypothetical protein
MKVEEYSIKETSIQEFADDHDLILEIRERLSSQL